MRASRKKFAQSGRRKRNRIGPDHGRDVEAVRACGRDQLPFERRGV
jgi:hypothetical protein